MKFKRDWNELQIVFYTSRINSIEFKLNLIQLQIYKIYSTEVEID